MDVNSSKTEVCDLKTIFKLKAAIQFGTVDDVKAIIEHGASANHSFKVSAYIFCFVEN